jgi:hypothetical protein
MPEAPRPRAAPAFSPWTIPGGRRIKADLAHELGMRVRRGSFDHPLPEEKMERNRCLAVLAAATCSLAIFANVAAAQTADHLKCFKIKDIAQFKSATADLVPANVSFPGQNCSLKGKGAQLCVPADKANVVVEEGTDNPFPNQALANAQLCYKVKCATTLAANLSVTDQFGARTVAVGKTTKVCGPAIQQ